MRPLTIIALCLLAQAQLRTTSARAQTAAHPTAAEAHKAPSTPPTPAGPPPRSASSASSGSNSDSDSIEPEHPPEPEPEHEHAASPQALAAALARYAHEPRVEQVVKAALAVLPKPRAAALASRARDAGWVPTLGLRARRGQDVDLSQTLGDQSLDVSTGDNLSLEGSLTFELDRVVFRSEEVALGRQAQAEDEQRKARLREVIALYFERRKLQLERDAQGDPSFARSVRIAEIEALLDVFTNGAFHRMMAGAAWTTAVSTPATPSRSQPKSKSMAKP